MKKILLITTIIFAGIIKPAEIYNPHDALIEAARKNDVQEAAKAITAGADVNHKNACRDSPLIIAALYGNKEIVEQLVKAGADVNKKAESSTNTPIMMTIRNVKSYKPGELEKAIEILKILIKAGANLNSKNLSGNTALALAALDDVPEIINLLVKNGADTTIINDNGFNYYEGYLRRNPAQLEKKKEAE